MTRAEALSMIRLMAGDPSGERWTDADVQWALDAAACEYALLVRQIVETLTVNTVQYQREYDVATRAREAGKRELAAILRVGTQNDAGPVLGALRTMDVDVAGTSAETWGGDLAGHGKIYLTYEPQRDYAGADEGKMIVSYLGLPGEADTAIDTLIPARDHVALCYGAAARLREEGSLDDVRQAVALDADFRRRVGRAVADAEGGHTQYGGFEA